MKAFLWDGNIQLSGKLQLTSEQLLFSCLDFKKSHLELKINLKEIELVELFQIYNLSVNGIKIISNQNKEDLFVVENPKLLKKQIEKMTHSKHK